MLRRKIMEYIVVAFRSRSDTVKLCDFLHQNSIPAEIVNTPKEAGVGCGLSIKINARQFSLVKKIVFKSKLNSFAGFFTVKIIGGRKFCKSI